MLRALNLSPDISAVAFFRRLAVQCEANMKTCAADQLECERAYARLYRRKFNQARRYLRQAIFRAFERRRALERSAALLKAGMARGLYRAAAE